MIGLSVYLVSAIAIVFIHSAGELLFWRWIQALGGGMATVTVGATVRDFFHGNEAAKMFATIGIIHWLRPCWVQHWLLLAAGGLSLYFCWYMLWPY